MLDLLFLTVRNVLQELVMHLYSRMIVRFSQGPIKVRDASSGAFYGPGDVLGGMSILLNIFIISLAVSGLPFLYSAWFYTSMLEFVGISVVIVPLTVIGWLTIVSFFIYCDPYRRLHHLRNAIADYEKIRSDAERQRANCRTRLVGDLLEFEKRQRIADYWSRMFDWAGEKLAYLREQEERTEQGLKWKSSH